MSKPARARRPSITPGAALARLASLRGSYGLDTAATKLDCLRVLESATLRTSADVLHLHELLCFLAAYPDDEATFARVDRMLQVFSTRTDLQRFRPAFVNSGIAGTDIVYPFFASTARWLAARWGERLTVAWDEGESTSDLETRLPLLTTWAERAVFDEPPLPMREWLDRLRGAETDAAFLVRRSAEVTGTTLLGDQLYDELNLTLTLAPGSDGPSRTTARAPRRQVATQAGPLRTARPDLQAAAREEVRHVSDVPRRDAERLIDLARCAMVTRKRDLYSFAAADPRDVRMVDFGDGMEFVLYGVRPEQRLLFDAVYSFLMLRNGVPIGYALASALWRSSEIAFNMFDTFRGGEAGLVYGRVLAVMRSLFDADTFTIYPYQLGHENDEGLESGAWWFYYKMGFRPKNAAVAALARREAERVTSRRTYRTSLATLKQLVCANLFLFLDRERQDVIGLLPTDRIALAASDLLGSRFASNRERATATLADEAAERLEAGPWRQWPDGERLWWERWAPIVALLDTPSWSPPDRASLVEVIRAKGARREGAFVTRFDSHALLRQGLLALTK
jgi:hypothetical protein